MQPSADDQNRAPGEEPPADEAPEDQSGPEAEPDGEASAPGADAEGGRLKKLRQRVVELDSDPAMVEAVDKLRRRLPGDTRFGDGISTSGKTSVERVGKGVSALSAERPSAIGQLGLGALQVWQSLSESAGRGRGPTPVALLFTDLVDFSSWALDVGDRASVKLLRDAGEVIEGAILDNDGKVVKRLGDGIMAAFDHPQEAAEAVLTAQEGLRDVEVEGYHPTMRAGVHFGHPRKIGGDYLGVDVNITARVGEGAQGGQLLMSDHTAQMLDSAAFHMGRSKRLKAAGAPRDLRVREIARAA
jgi:class 3 adenylate cyclase